MIRIGQLPSMPRPLGARRRTMAYTGRRLHRRRGPRSARAPGPDAVNTAAMIFDQPPAELPVATLRPRDSAAQLALDARGWLAARWQWLRPRAIPVVVAFAGMVGVIASASYLRELEPPQGVRPALVVRIHGQEPAAAAPRAASATAAASHTGGRCGAKPALTARTTKVVDPAAPAAAVLVSAATAPR